MAQNSDYYDWEKTISYQAPVTIVTSARGYGKTYGLTKAAIKDWIKDGSEFAYVRRYHEEMRIAKYKVFSDIEANNEFPNLEFRVEGDYGFCRYKESKDWSVICHFFTASRADDYKGATYPKVKKIIYDEYIRKPHRNPGYLPDDVGNLFSLISTIVRRRTNAKVYLLGNSEDIVNPIFMFLGVKGKPKNGYKWYRNKKFLLHYVKNAQAQKTASDSFVGKLVSGTQYNEVIVQNDFANASNQFIADKPKRAKYEFGVKFMDNKFGFWSDFSEGLFYVNDKIPNNSENVYAFSTHDMQPNLIMIERYGNLVKRQIELYRYGLLRFDSQQTRELFLDMLSLCGLK